MSDRRSAPSAWSKDALLGRRAAVQMPRFVRSPWDEPAAQDFGPWRISPKPDPAQSQSTPAPQISGPRNEPVSNADVSTPKTPEAPTSHDAGQALNEIPAPPRTGASAMAHPSAPPRATSASPGVSTPDPARLKAAEDAAYKRGLADGHTQEQEAVKAQREKERELLRNLSIELRSLQQQPERFFEPLKKLAMHLAETLVRSELQTSEKAINALIEACVNQLDPNGEPVMVSLNPSDLERIQAMGDPVTSQLRLSADPALRQGSVRAQVQDTVVQDLIDHRLDALARRVLADPQAWLQRSSLLNDVVDAMPDETPGRHWQMPKDDITDVPTDPGNESTP